MAKRLKVYPTGYNIDIPGIDDKITTYCDKKGCMYVGTVDRMIPLVYGEKSEQVYFDEWMDDTYLPDVRLGYSPRNYSQSVRISKLRYGDRQDFNKTDEIITQRERLTSVQKSIKSLEDDFSKLTRQVEKLEKRIETLENSNSELD